VAADGPFYAACAIAALFLSDESIAIVEKVKPEFFCYSSLTLR
jgi:hypothetical protein